MSPSSLPGTITPDANLNRAESDLGSSTSILTGGSTNESLHTLRQTRLLSSRRSATFGDIGGKRRKYVAVRRRDGRLPLASKDKNVFTSGSSGGVDSIKQSLSLSKHSSIFVKNNNNGGITKSRSPPGSNGLLLQKIKESDNEEQNTSLRSFSAREKRLVLKDGRDAAEKDIKISHNLKTQTRTRPPEDYEREVEFVPKKYDEKPYVPDDYSPLEESDIQKLREFHSDALLNSLDNEDDSNGVVQESGGLLKLEVFHDASDSDTDQSESITKVKVKNRILATFSQKQGVNSDLTRIESKGTIEQAVFSGELVELDPIYNGQGLSSEDLEELLLD